MNMGSQASFAGTERAALRPGLAFIPLDGDLVVFSQEAQSLVGLNATAAFIANRLRQGVPLEGIASALAEEKGVDFNQAVRWVSDALTVLDSQGLLAGNNPSAPPAAQTTDRLVEKVPPFTDREPAVEGRYRLLGVSALIRYGHRSQKRMVDTVIGHLQAEEAGAPALTIDIHCEFWKPDWIEWHQIASDIYCNGIPEARASRLSGLGPLVKSALWVHAVNAHEFILDLHAGVVGQDGRCILLPAAAGSGKSSLTAALVHSGLGYYSDEVALIEPGTFQVVPVPLAVCVKSTAWDLMSRYYPDIHGLPMHRRDDGKQVKYVRPRSESVQKRPAQVSHIFFPRYAKDHPTELVAVSRLDALARIMDQCLALRLQMTPESVKELVRWISGIETYTLTFSSLDEAVALVKTTACFE
jgi:coenzyme PQQ synthesis protein D (PqqD)